MRRLPLAVTLRIASSMCSRFDGRMLAQQRQFDVLLLGQMQRRAQVLGQARAAEREARLQVGARDVELRVAAHQVHHLERIDAQRFAQSRGFVGERDLQRVEVVAAVLDHLRRAHRRHVEVARQVAEQSPQHLRCVIAAGADDRERRVVVVADRRAFAQELRLEADVEVPALLLAGGFLHQRAQHALHRARHQGRAEHEGVHMVDVGQRRAEFAARSRSTAVWSWLPLAADGVPTQISDSSVSRRASPALLVTLTRPLATTLAISSTMPSSTTGVLPSRISCSFAASTSTPSDVVTLARQAGQRHGADVTESEDADFHEVAACEADRMEEAG